MSFKKPQSAITQLLRNRADAVLDANSSENLNRSSSDSNTFTQFSIFQGKPAFFGSQASDETIEQKPKYGDYDLYVPYKSVISYRHQGSTDHYVRRPTGSTRSEIF